MDTTTSKDLAASSASHFYLKRCQTVQSKLRQSKSSLRSRGSPKSTKVRVISIVIVGNKAKKMSVVWGIFFDILKFYNEFLFNLSIILVYVPTLKT